MPPTLTQTTVPLFEYIVGVGPRADQEQTIRAASALAAARMALPHEDPATLNVHPGADGWRVTTGQQSRLVGVVWRAWRVVPAGDRHHTQPVPGYYASQAAAAREAERLSRLGLAHMAVQRTIGAPA